MASTSRGKCHAMMECLCNPVLEGFLSCFFLSRIDSFLLLDKIPISFPKHITFNLNNVRLFFHLNISCVIPFFSIVRNDERGTAWRTLRSSFVLYHVNIIA